MFPEIWKVFKYKHAEMFFEPEDNAQLFDGLEKRCRVIVEYQ